MAVGRSFVRLFSRWGSVWRCTVTADRLLCFLSPAATLINIASSFLGLPVLSVPLSVCLSVCVLYTPTASVNRLLDTQSLQRIQPSFYLSVVTRSCLYFSWHNSTSTIICSSIGNTGQNVSRFVKPKFYIINMFCMSILDIFNNGLIAVHKVSK